MKALLLLAACAAATPALAADYLYDVSMPFYPGTIDNTGWIMTNCDSCTLSAKNIVGWSMSQTNPAMTGFGGVPFTASSLPGSGVSVLGSGLVASATGISFDFAANGPYADVWFTSHDNSVHFTNTSDSPYASGGTLEDCSARLGICAGSSFSTRESIGRRAAPVAAPEIPAAGGAAALSLLAASLLLVRGRRTVRGRA